MGIEVGTALLASAIIGGGAAAYSANKAKSAQEDATAQATKDAKTTADAAAEATNRANQKKPDTAAALGNAQGNGKGGASGTMLTGPNGIDPAALQLGKTTLLGA